MIRCQFLVFCDSARHFKLPINLVVSLASHIYMYPTFGRLKKLPPSISASPII